MWHVICNLFIVFVIMLCIIWFTAWLMIKAENDE